MSFSYDEIQGGIYNRIFFGIIIDKIQLHSIIMFLQLVYFKPKEDILQGMNKLDYLLRSSIF